MDIRDEFAFKALTYIRGTTYALRTIDDQGALDEAIEDITAMAYGAYAIADVMLNIREKSKG
jgi:hypothetical protein